MDTVICCQDKVVSVPSYTLLPLPSFAFLSFGLLKMRYSSRFLELAMLEALELLCRLRPGGLAADVRGEKRET